MDRNGARPFDLPPGPPSGNGEGSNVSDQFDVTLEDADLLREVELTMNLMVAASSADDRLSQEEIDRILGVEKEPPAEV
jgi:hypothetical protein